MVMLLFSLSVSLQFKLQVYTTCLVYLFVLSVRASCLYYTSILTIYSTCPFQLVYIICPYHLFILIVDAVCLSYLSILSILLVRATCLSCTCPFSLSVLPVYTLPNLSILPVDQCGLYYPSIYYPSIPVVHSDCLFYLSALSIHTSHLCQLPVTIYTYQSSVYYMFVLLVAGTSQQVSPDTC